MVIAAAVVSVDGADRPIAADRPHRVGLSEAVTSLVFVVPHVTRQGADARTQFASLAHVATRRIGRYCNPASRRHRCSVDQARRSVARCKRQAPMHSH